MQSEFNIHLVTQFGGHTTPSSDVIWAKPSPWTEGFSREKLGFVAEARVLAKGPYNGGMSRDTYDDIVTKCGLIRLKQDQLAINPDVSFEIGTFDANKDPAYKQNATFLEFNGEGLLWSGQMPVRFDIKSTIDEVMDLFPKAKLNMPSP